MTDLIDISEIIKGANEMLAEVVWQYVKGIENVKAVCFRGC